MCRIWWPSRTQQGGARKEVGWVGLSMEVEVGQEGHSVEEGAAEDLVEALGVETSHIGQA